MKTLAILALTVCAMTLTTASADEPKGYKISLPDARIAGVDVNSGDYKLLVHLDEPRVQLMEIKTGNMIDLKAKVENADAKFSRTEVHSEDKSGAKQINEIRIGGTKVRVDFRQPS